MAFALEWMVLEYRDGDQLSSDSSRGNFRDLRDNGDPTTVNLVREALQNILDKRRDHARPVLARLGLHEPDAAAYAAIESTYLGKLLPHIEAALPHAYARAAGSTRFLTIEDFNTYGLQGDPRERPKGRSFSPNNDFAYFWRAQNLRGERASGGGGSHGVGKTVYYMASSHGTVLGWSRPMDTTHATHTLMGKAHLEPHRLGEQDYIQFGFGGSSTPGSTFIAPRTDAAACLAFKDAWRLTREDEPGLSIVIPRIRAEVTADGLIRATLAQYSYPILAGEMAVEIRAEDGTTTVIDRDTVLTVAGAIDLSEDVKRRIDLCTTLIRSGHSTVLDEWQPGKVTPEDRFPADELEDARAAFEAGVPVHIKVPTRIRKKGSVAGDPSIARVEHVDVLIRKSDQPTMSVIRSGLWIMDEPKNPRGVPRAEMLTVISRPADGEECSLSELLGKLEGGSHVDWTEPTDDDRREMRYLDAATVRGAIRTLAIRLGRLVSIRNDSEPFPFASDWFPLPTPNPHGSSGDPKPKDPKGEGGPAGKKPRPPRGARPMVRVAQDPHRADKFTFTLTGSTKIDVLHLRLAYARQDSSRGDALRTWIDEDFTIAPKRGRGSHPVVIYSQPPGRKHRVSTVRNNVITCRDVDPADFALTVEGFGTTRGVVWDAEALNHDGTSIVLSMKED